MNYEIVTIDSVGGPQDHVIITREDGSFESFPVDETNPRYQQFLEQLDSEPKV